MDEDDYDRHHESIVLLMHKRMEEGFKNKRLAANNNMFLRLLKILMTNEIPQKIRVKGLDLI